MTTPQKTEPSRARQLAHNHFVYPEGNGCEMVCRALASIGQHREHSIRCDQDTAFLEAHGCPQDVKP